jgi:signal transduction histidine kinase
MTDSKIQEILHFLGDCSHDMKNMLQPILMGSRLLKEELQDFFEGFQDSATHQSTNSYERCLELIDMVIKNSLCVQQHSKEFVDCVIALSCPLQFGPCDVAQVVNTTIHHLSYSCKEQGVAVRTKGLKELPAIQADARRLFSAFFNLINNAIPEIPAGGTITIKGHRANNWIEVEVADTGKGMPPKVLAQLFTHQKTLSQKTLGNGYGMKGVKSIIEAHHGEIWIESKVDVGTKIHVLLPVEPLSQNSEKSEQLWNTRNQET